MDEYLDKLKSKFDNEITSELVTEYDKYKKLFIKKLSTISKYTLNGSVEINDPLAHNIKYYCILCNNKLTLSSFKKFIILYYIESLIYKKLYLPLDYEFNTKIIALCQLNFELNHNDTKYSVIYIIYPPELDTETLKFFKDNIMCNHRIYKILHGSDSLDIPYTYNTFFNNNKEDIVKFTSSLIDTKYLCEYYHIDNKIEDKCKIKELLLEHNVINKIQYDNLVKNEEKMGNISDIKIDINNISDELFKYSMYDVLFLKYLYLKFESIDIDIYKNLIPEITRYIYMERRNVIKITEKIDNIIYRLNLATIPDFDQNLHTIFYNLLFVIYDEKIINIFKINYFKKIFFNLLKAITYHILIENYKITMNNKTEFNGFLNIAVIFNNLREYNLSTIFNLLNIYKEKSIEYLV